MNELHRRCIYIDSDGIQCEHWVPISKNTKLCLVHSDTINPTDSPESKERYIDLVNDQREFCYQFKDGSESHQDKTLVFEFKDDGEGTKLDKIEKHIAFLERVLEDVRARTYATKAIRGEQLDALSEEERKKRRAIKVERVARETREKKPTIKSDPVKYLMMKNPKMTEAMAREFLGLN